MPGAPGPKGSERNSFLVFTDLWLLLQKQVIRAKVELLFTFPMKICQILNKQQKTKTFFKDLRVLLFTGQDKSKMLFKIKIHSKTAMKAILH